MNQITDRPNEYPAGLSFNYNLWTPGSVVTLLNVPWDSGHEYCQLFPDKASRNAYLDNISSKLTLSNVTYLRQDQPIRLEIPFGIAQKYNYIRVDNPAQPVVGDVGTSFFYFIRRAIHRSPSTTEFIIQLDVWQSFAYDVQFRSGYLERGHLAVKYGKQSGLNELNWLDAPEGIDTGTDYTTIGATYNSGLSFTSGDYLISSTVSLTASPGTSTNPAISSAMGTRIATKNVAYDVKHIDANNLPAYLLGMAQFPWITSAIVRVVAIPNIPASRVTPVPKNGTYPPGSTGANSYLNTLNEISPTAIYSIPNWDFGSEMDSALSSVIPDFAWLDKLKTAPYSYLRMYDNAGNEVMLDTAKFASRSGVASFNVLTSLIPFNEALIINPAGYNGSSTSLVCALKSSSFPTVPVMNNAALAAQASSAHSITNARQSADWAYQKNMAGIQTSYDNSTIGLNESANQSRISRNSDIVQTGLTNANIGNQAALSAATSIVGSAGAGAVAGPAGAGAGAAIGAGNALVSGASTAMNIHYNTASLGARNSSAVESANSSYGAGAGIRDNNRALAEYGAKGDYAATIAAIDAKMRDTQLTPPSISGEYGGEVSMWAVDKYGIFGEIKTLRRSALWRVGAYWARYGYAANKFIDINNELVLMTKATYWKVHDLSVYAPGGLSEDYINVFRGIFAKGATIVTDPSVIYENFVQTNKPKDW